MFKSNFSNKFVKAYVKLPLAIQKKFDKQIAFLLQDLRYPSVRAKKVESYEDIWEGRVDQSYRFTFKIKGDSITLLGIGPHDEGLGKK